MPTQDASRIVSQLTAAGWFKEPGAYVSVDGQFGSTGKGVVVGMLAELFGSRVNVAVTNAGPNSGHTSWSGGRKVVLKQLPTFAVIAALRTPYGPMAYLNAGAVIDPAVLEKEKKEYPTVRVIVHPNAAVIRPEEVQADFDNVNGMASTGQGVGPALIRKLGRTPGAVYGGTGHPPEMHNKVCFVEVSQGFSLGINSGFYPYVTTRECTASQALADAGLPPTAFQKCVMSVRTYPIRVGNTSSTSGPGYPDQKETDWATLGVEPEFTTVTQRVRRVFTWSKMQYEQALRANAPSVIFINFCNYLQSVAAVDAFIEKNVHQPYLHVMRRPPDAILMGTGPRSDDVRIWDRRA